MEGGTMFFQRLSEIAVSIANLPHYSGGDWAFLLLGTCVGAILWVAIVAGGPGVAVITTVTVIMPTYFILMAFPYFDPLTFGIIFMPVVGLALSLLFGYFLDRKRNPMTE